MWLLCAFCFVATVIFVLLAFGSVLRNGGKLLKCHLGYFCVGIVELLYDV